MIKNINVVTHAFGYCPKCKGNKEMEILELENIGVAARCIQCGSIYLLPINLDEYFKNYQRKGGQNERKEKDAP